MAHSSDWFAKPLVNKKFIFAVDGMCFTSIYTFWVQKLKKKSPSIKNDLNHKHCKNIEIL